jgi:hypothetical protein
MLIYPNEQTEEPVQMENSDEKKGGEAVNSGD